jgi:hypothetical protein
MISMYGRDVDMFKWDADFKRDSYLIAARSRATCRNRKRKQNMLHVKRKAKLKKRKS